MAGWSLKKGVITEYAVSEDRIWSLFNYVFSDACKKRNTYKFGFIKALLDSAFSGDVTQEGVCYNYESLFGRFACNYWNLIVKYNLKQMRKDGKSEFSRVERIIKSAVSDNTLLSSLGFEAVGQNEKTSVIKQITAECKRYVIGALYDDFDGIIYSFDLKEDKLIINPCLRVKSFQISKKKITPYGYLWYP